MANAVIPANSRIADVLSSAKAYEFYLRGNQPSYDSRQWALACDLYQGSVEEDPSYAPAWVRLGRIRHLMSKYPPAGKSDGLQKAEAALRRALELQGWFRTNPSSTNRQSKTDLNTATERELLNLPNMNGAIARKIEVNRPFRSTRELVTKGITSEEAYERIRDLIDVK